jgi:hypothetical protein
MGQIKEIKIFLVGRGTTRSDGPSLQTPCELS